MHISELWGETVTDKTYTGSYATKVRQNDEEIIRKTVLTKSSPTPGSVVHVCPFLGKTTIRSN